MKNTRDEAISQSYISKEHFQTLSIGYLGFPAIRSSRRML